MFVFWWIRAVISKDIHQFHPVCLLLYNSPCGISKSWDGDVPSSDSDHSGPRIHCLLLCRFLLNPPRTLLLTSDVRLRGQPTPAQSPHLSTSFMSPHEIILPLGGSVFVPAYWKSLVPYRVPHSPYHRPYASISPSPPLTYQFQGLTLPPLHIPRHVFWIPIASGPSLLPKYLSTRPSAVF